MLGTPGEVRKDKEATFSYGLLLMDTPVLANKPTLTLNEHWMSSPRTTAPIEEM